jgi:hypothetical protein
MDRAPSVARRRAELVAAPARIQPVAGSSWGAASVKRVHKGQGEWNTVGICTCETCSRAAVLNLCAAVALPDTHHQERARTVSQLHTPRALRVPAGYPDDRRNNAIRSIWRARDGRIASATRAAALAYQLCCTT